MSKISVLFLCRANICRSPMAEGILKGKIKSLKLEKHIKVDSAGTQAVLLKARPDARAQKVALRHGVDISKLKSRKFHEKDLNHDYILVMDRGQLKDLGEKYPSVIGSKARLFMDFCEDRCEISTESTDQSTESEIPDPYYGNVGGFEHVYHLLDLAADSFLKEICRRLGQ